MYGWKRNETLLRIYVCAGVHLCGCIGVCVCACVRAYMCIQVILLSALCVQFHGNGTYFNKNGDIYAGDWKENSCHGKVSSHPEC